MERCLTRLKAINQRQSWRRLKSHSQGWTVAFAVLPMLLLVLGEKGQVEDMAAKCWRASMRVAK